MRRQQRSKGGLFWPVCIETGFLRDGSWSAHPVERDLTRKEIAEAHRLWAKHADIRRGLVKP